MDPTTSVSTLLDPGRFLAAVGEALAASLDFDATLGTVARLAVPALADFCIVDLLDAGMPQGVRRVAATHVDAGRAAVLASVRDVPPRLDSDGIVARTLRTGQPQLVSPLSAEERAASTAGRPALLPLLDELAPEALMCVPIAAHGTTLGALLLASAGSGRRYGAAELAVATEVGRRAGLAVDNARLHRDAVRARASLEAHAQELQEQAALLESQQQELEQQVEEQQVLTEELQQTNEELYRANAAAQAARLDSERAVRDVRAILESISDPFVVYDAEWRFRYVNDPALVVFRRGMHGESAEQRLGATLWEAYPEVIGTPFERAMRRAHDERTPVAFEEYLAATGRWTDVRCYPLPDGGLAVTWRDVTDRKRREEAQRYLSEATSLLASSLDYETTLAALARLVVPDLADWSAVAVVEDDGTVKQLAVAHVDPAKVRFAHELNERYPPDPDAPIGVPNVLRTGRSELLAEIPDALLVAGARDEEHLRISRALGLRSAMVVPLLARGRTLGALTLVSAESNRRYTADDIVLAEELARRAALAVDNARLHRAALAAERAAAGHAANVERFRLAQESSPDGFVLLEVVRDDHGHVVDFVWDYANAAALRLQESTLDALRGQGVLERNPALADSPMFAGFVRAVETGAPYEDEIRYRRGWIDTWLRVIATPLDHGLAVTFADVSRRKRAEERARDLHELTRALAAATSRESVAALVLDRAIPALGLAAGSLVEYDASRHELHVLGARGFDHGELDAWMRYPLRAGTPGTDAILTGEIVTVESHGEWRMRYPAHAAWVEATGIEGSAAVPLRLGERTLGFVAVQVRGPRAFDAEERRFLAAIADQCAQALERVRLFDAEVQARLDAERLREVAETANLSKTQFLASMSHELRTPLNAIGGYAQLLLLGVRGPVTPMQATDLERIARSQRHLLGVINDILNFARLEAGFVEYELRPVDVGELLADAEPLVAPQLAARSLAYECDPGPRGLCVRADAEKLRQVVLNLLSNAVKFTAPGGRIAVAAAAIDDRVAIRVHDTGIGIAPEKLETIFEPFVQVHRTHATPMEGTGLGLAISRDLARGMGGDLTVESALGIGSTFTLTLARA